jgi:hypothetical protein
LRCLPAKKQGLWKPTEEKNREKKQSTPCGRGRQQGEPWPAAEGISSLF